MFLDGLEDAYDKGRLMGTFAEDCADEVSLHARGAGRVRDRVAARARSAANDDGTFAWEIAPVTVAGRKGDTVVDRDEQPFKAMPDKIPTLQARRSARTARSRRPTRARSPTAPRRWC